MTTISRSKYIRVKVVIEQWIEKNKDLDPVKMVSHLAIATECPVIIVCQFVGELHGFSEELQRIMHVIMKFYKIDTIIE